MMTSVDARTRLTATDGMFETKVSAVRKFLAAGYFLVSRGSQTTSLLSAHFALTSTTMFSSRGVRAVAFAAFAAFALLAVQVSAGSVTALNAKTFKAAVRAPAGHLII